MSQVTDEVEATYFKRQAIDANVGEPSRRNEVVVEDLDSDDELLYDGVRRWFWPIGV